MKNRMLVGFLSFAFAGAAFGAWYDEPATMKLVPLATGVSTTEDPHFMNKSADDRTLLVNMQASNDNDGPILLDMAELAAFGVTPTIRKVVAKPSSVGGIHWKGGAISSDLGLAIVGSGSAQDSCSFLTDATSWTKGQNLWRLTLPNKMDGLDFGTGSKYLYSNLYPDGGIARMTVSVNGGLVDQVTKPTTTTRVRNVSAYQVNGRELVFYGNGADNTTDGRVYVMDVTDADTANWTETELKLGDDAVVVPGVITNVKLSNEDSDAPILYALSDNGYLGVFKLAADGKSVVEAIKTIEPAVLKALAGGSETTAAKFRNFEVTKDGETAFLINRADSHTVSLAVLQTLPTAYVESDGTSFIDTGYTPTRETAIYCDFEYTDKTAQQFIFEAGDSVSATNANFKAYFRQYISGSGLYAWAMNRNLWWHNNLTATVGERCQELLDSPGKKVTFCTPAVTKSSTVEEWSKSKNPASTTLKLFSNGSGNGNKAKARIYQVRVYEAGELVHDFLPATRDGLIGFYDEISGEFICNKSGFTFGGVESLPEVPEGPYIESDGTAGINTGVQCQPGLKVEVDFRITVPFEQMVAQWRIVATDADDKYPRLSAYVNASMNIALSSGDAWASSTSTGIRADTQRHKVILGAPGNKCYYTIGNSAQATISGNAFTKKSLTQIALLATPNKPCGATFGNKAVARIYRARFWVNDTLIRDFQPRTVDGVAGLEEVVQGGFYTADGYTASADTPEGLTATPAYIENDGSFFSYVNTYYCASPKTKVSVDYQMVKLEASKIVWGTYGNSVGLTTLMWHDSSSWAYPQAKNDSYSAPTMSPKIYMDSARHTSIVDIPAQRLAVLDSTGAVESEGTISMPTKSAAWPIMLFTGSNDKYGHPYKSQIATCRIYGAKIWEKEGDEYVLKHNFEPVLLAGIPGFRDTVTGKFHSGDKLKAGGPVPDMADDSYVENPSGGKYFDTGYKVTKNTSVWMDFMPLLQQTAQQFPYEAGLQNSTGVMYIRAYGNGSAGTGDYSHAFGTDCFKPTYVPYQPNVRVQLYHDAAGKRFVVLRDGVELGSTNIANWAYTDVSAQSSATLKLLCNSGMNSASCRARLYGVKIYENGELVHDYVPVAQAGKGALVDKVGGKILNKASNSQEFVVSDDLVTNDGWIAADMRAGDAYIQSDGTQVLNTGYRSTPQTRFEVDYQMTAIRGQNRVFGSVTGNSIAEMYVQGEAEGSGNVAYMVGDTQVGQYTGLGADLNRHRGVLDLYTHTVGYTGWGYKAATTFTATRNTGPIGIFTKNCSENEFSGWAAKNVAKMKLYAFRIYEAGELVHQYLPYKNGATVGLYDTVTGDILTKLAAGTSEANEFAYGGEGYGQYLGEPIGLVVKPGDVSVFCGETRELAAYTPGAIGYRWKMNGYDIADATSGTLTVGWHLHRGDDKTDTYTVAPIFLIDGEEVEGEAAAAVVTSLPRGTAIIIR